MMFLRPRPECSQQGMEVGLNARSASIGIIPEGTVFPIWINRLPSKANRCLFHFGMIRVADIIPVLRVVSGAKPALKRPYKWRLLVLWIWIQITKFSGHKFR